jgi:membrane protein
MRAAHSALLGEMPILAAGTALFAILAVVPMLAAAVAIYGLAADPFEIHGELKSLQHVMPVEVVNFIGDQLERQRRGRTPSSGYSSSSASCWRCSRRAHRHARSSMRSTAPIAYANSAPRSNVLASH